MPALALLYPGLVLARLGDPLEIARTLGAALPVPHEALFEAVRGRVRGCVGATPGRLGWIGPARPKLVLGGTIPPRSPSRGDGERRHSCHACGDGAATTTTSLALRPTCILPRASMNLILGRRPADLDVVLTKMAIAGPGVCALRALSRVTGGVDSLAGHRDPRRRVPNRARAPIAVQQARNRRADPVRRRRVVLAGGPGPLGQRMPASGARRVRPRAHRVRGPAGCRPSHAR